MYYYKIDLLPYNTDRMMEMPLGIPEVQRNISVSLFFIKDR